MEIRMLAADVAAILSPNQVVIYMSIVGYRVELLINDGEGCSISCHWCRINIDVEKDDAVDLIDIADWGSQRHQGRCRWVFARRLKATNGQTITMNIVREINHQAQHQIDPNHYYQDRQDLGCWFHGAADSPRFIIDDQSTKLRWRDKVNVPGSTNTSIRVVTTSSY